MLVVIKVVSSVVDLEAPLEHIFRDYHSFSLIVDRDAQLVWQIIIVIIPCFVDQTGIVRRRCPAWNALRVMVPCDNLVTLIESERKRAFPIALLRPLTRKVCVKIEDHVRENSEFLEAGQHIVAWHFELVIDEKLFSHNLPIIYVSNILLQHLRIQHRFFVKLFDLLSQLKGKSLGLSFNFCCILPEITVRGSHSCNSCD